MGLIRVSAGTTKGYGTKLIFADSNGISFGYSSHTVTATPWRASYLECGLFESANSVTGSSNAPNLSYQRFQVSNPITATRMDFLQNWTVAASTNGSYTMRMAVYTRSGSTLGSLSATSAVVTHTSAAANSTNTAGYSAQSGTQWRSYPVASWAFSPGEYWLAVMGSVDGPAGTTGSMTLYGRSAISIANGAVLAPGSANPVSVWDAGGIFSTGTASPPASVHISDLNRTGSYALAQPGFRLVGSLG
jgi:roadblock/LC7 domain-containing protein